MFTAHTVSNMGFSWGNKAKDSHHQFERDLRIAVQKSDPSTLSKLLLQEAKSEPPLLTSKSLLVGDKTLNSKKNFRDIPLLELAIQGGNGAVVSMLLNVLERKGWIIPPCSATTGNSLLHHACAAGNPKVVEMLITKIHQRHKMFTNYFEASGLEQENGEGMTCLMIAAAHGHTELIEYLLSLEVDVNAERSDGWTALFVAAKWKQKEALQALGEVVDINEPNSKGITVLVEMVRLSLEESVVMLLDMGADINVRDSKLRTPLHHAVLCDDGAMVALLTEMGCLLDLTDENGRTALFIAAATGKDLLVGYLLSRKADVSIVDCEDKHLVDLAPDSTRELIRGISFFFLLGESLFDILLPKDLLST